jgi:hypothetical protein
VVGHAVSSYGPRQTWNPQHVNQKADGVLRNATALTCSQRRHTWVPWVTRIRDTTGNRWWWVRGLT